MKEFHNSCQPSRSCKACYIYIDRVRDYLLVGSTCRSVFKFLTLPHPYVDLYLIVIYCSVQKILLDFLLPSLEAAALQALAVPLLDLLLIAFIDSPINKQLFESSGGLEILIKAMKNKHIRKDVRVKVLETVWGWWIEDDDEKEPTETVPTGHSKVIDLPPGSAPLQPNLTSASTPMRKQSTPSSTSFGSSTPVAVQFHTSALSKQSVSSGRKAPDHDRPGRSTSREERSSGRHCSYW